MRQYEIWWAHLPEPVGRRPVMLLSRDSAYDYLSRVLVGEVTSTVRAIPVEVPLGRKEGLRRRCVVNLDNVHVVPKARLRTRIGTLSVRRIPEVKRALGYALDWAELKDAPART
jgi:mRNA interferase MazF